MKIKAKPTLPKLKKLSSKSPPKLQSSSAAQEWETGLKRYLEESGNDIFGFRRRRLLYERPWFLVLGPEGSGKSTLLSDCGIEFPLVYPSVEDGYVPGETAQPSVVWWCEHKAVWLDLPGRLLTETGRPALKEVSSFLAKTRPQCPINGIVVVLDCAKISERDVDEVQAEAASIRSVFDFLIKSWGVELPVYLVFTQADRITGFSELFADEAGRWNDRILGATVQGLEIGIFPRVAFLEQFEPMIQSLTDIRLRMLAKETNEERRSAMCRFPIDITALREKIAVCVATLFKQSSYAGKPEFRGFYFAACPPGDATTPVDGAPDSGLDLFDHPLNPHRRRSGRDAAPETKQRRPFFAKPLFSRIIPEGGTYAAATRNRFRREVTRLSLRIAAAAVPVIIVAIILGVSLSNIRKLERDGASILTSPTPHNSEGIRNLVQMRDRYLAFSRYTDGKRTIAMRLTGYNADKSFSAVRALFASAVRHALLSPSRDILEHDLYAATISDNTGYDELKSIHRAYLAISDQALTYPALLDGDSVVVDVLLSRLRDRVVPDARADAGTAESIRTILHTWLSLARADTVGSAIPRERTDPNLVGRTQQKLAGLIDPAVTYELIVSRSRTDKPGLSVKEIIPNVPNARVLQTGTMLDAVYTPEQWRNEVLPAIISSAAGKREREKWVTGDTPIPSDIDSVRFVAALTKLYFEDVVRSWTDFLSSVHVVPFSSLSTAARTTAALCARKNPTVELLNKLVAWSSEYEVPELGSDAHSRFKSQVAYLSEFVDGYYPQYLETLAALSKGIADAQNNKSVAAVFDGGQNDPLVNAYAHFQQTLAPLFETQRWSSLQSLASSPLSESRSALVDPLTRELNAVWKERVYDAFERSLSGKFPFTKSDREAGREAVLRYFRPLHGPFWNTFDEYLSNRIIERNNDWKLITEKAGLVPISINPRVKNSLRHAQVVTRVFFNPEGKSRTWSVALMPLSSSVQSPALVVNGTEQNFAIGKNVELTWPSKTSDMPIAVRGTDALGNTGARSHHGPWSLMRLLNESVSRRTDSPFIPEFDILVSLRMHGKSLAFPARVAVSDANHPFCMNVFDGFSVPEVLVK